MSGLDYLAFAVIGAGFGWALWANRSIHASSVPRSMARRKSSRFLAWF
jgi:hypothetical protein